MVTLNIGEAQSERPLRFNAINPVCAGPQLFCL
jgi:hypothetical protein